MAIQTPIKIDWDLVEMWNPAIGRKKLGISGTGGTVPPGGTKDQVLAKNSPANFDTYWADEPIGIPSGGTTGQVLEKNSNVNFDASWKTVTSQIFTAQNKDAFAFFIGAALARHPSGTGLIFADATGIAHKAVGLATIGVPPLFAETVQLDGVFTMNDWTNVTGTVNLQALADYYLSVTPGMLSVTSPVLPGQIAQVVGFALSPTTLMVNPEIAVLL